MGASRWNDMVTKYRDRAWHIIRAEWHLGLTAFGGPPVHFKIMHEKFVVKLKWLDDPLFQELFGVCQALSGPASTKMLYCINLVHDGFFGALLGFLLWSIPGACGMFGLSVGVSNISSTLPRPVYALLSGLNAATVGVIALAAVELSNKSITGKLTRTLLFLSATAGMLYNALWYFPLLIFMCGFVAIVHDYRWLHGPVKRVCAAFQWRRTANSADAQVVDTEHGSHTSHTSLQHLPRAVQRPATATSLPENEDDEDATVRHEATSTSITEPRIVAAEYRLNFSWKTGTGIILVFLATFVGVMVVRGVLPSPSILYRLFANMYLAGTIIFGGGPVVIPLLREYVVAEGWVSPRDFLIGLAIAQAFPGPNFNFAVFLGGLTASNNGYPTASGAIIAYLGIFVPGIVLVHGTMGVWGSLRAKRWVKSAVKGVNAGAVGLIYTAVYRIWLVGYIDEGFQSGRSLGDDPWWVVVAATAYVGGRYYGVTAPVAIMVGAVLGLLRYGVVSGRG